MCTLTYLLNEHGYDLIFNRDEQRSRSLALTPSFNSTKNAIYPIDPQGQGTWLAVNNKGLSLALLNYYQAPLSTSDNIISRGGLILSLLDIEGDVLQHLQSMDLSVYQPFQLCIFPENLSTLSPTVHSLKWSGTELFTTEADLPITSSSVDFDGVSIKRKSKFSELVDANTPTLTQLKDFHFSKETEGKNSVNMERVDAQTVSVSHISVNHDIQFNYIDNVVNEEHSVTINKVS